MNIMHSSQLICVHMIKNYKSINLTIMIMTVMKKIALDKNGLRGKEGEIIFIHKNPPIPDPTKSLALLWAIVFATLILKNVI